MLELSLGAVRATPPPAMLVEAASAVDEQLGVMPPIHTSLLLAAWRGQEARVAELAAAGVEDASPAAEARAVALARYARALLCNGLSQYEPALAAAEEACGSGERPVLPWALPELIEAATRAGKWDTAVAAAEQLAAVGPAIDSERTLGLGALARALAGSADGADARYREALDKLDEAGLPLHLSRARLLYGEWLRRQGRRVDAREQLRAAEATFDRAGAAGFGERARRELMATGETVRRRNVETRDELTPQEAHITSLAARGYTNSEIGARLFLSPRTVEWHLHKVFTKLGISSRRELREELPVPYTGANGALNGDPRSTPPPTFDRRELR